MRALNEGERALETRRAFSECGIDDPLSLDFGHVLSASLALVFALAAAKRALTRL